jgi:hypothetical protein
VGSIPRAAASLRKLVSASSLSRNSYSTLPLTAFNSRIQTSNNRRADRSLSATMLLADAIGAQSCGNLGFAEADQSDGRA